MRKYGSLIGKKLSTVPEEAQMFDLLGKKFKF